MKTDNRKQMHTQTTNNTVEVPQQRIRERTQTATERILDIIVSLAAILVVSPLLLIVAIAVRIDSPGKVIFSQRRAGLGGRPFVIYKFRSMAANAGDGAQAKRNDRRVTRIGAFIRKTSIDELPQLFNVLKGDMSVVGPRPHPLWLDEQMSPHINNYMNRYSVKPGITGLAQVSGHRGETSSINDMRERILCDLEYIHFASIGLYLRILVATLIVVLTKTRSVY